MYKDLIKMRAGLELRREVMMSAKDLRFLVDPMMVLNHDEISALCQSFLDCHLPAAAGT